MMAEVTVSNPYIGDVMHQCMIHPFDFRNAYAVVVSGAMLNPCGHLLLNTGGRGGWYFHIAQLKGHPRFMRENGFRRYVTENQKKELSRTYLTIPNRAAAHQKLEELLAKQWTWFMIANNCATFIEDIVKAGGGDAGLYFNCPSSERFI